ncbi:MAG TPA: cupin domain-containing protein [Bryobacteraceae bacterium]|nr:cupin domain-containing protein [Bryobacteraceae bacterium]
MLKSIGVLLAVSAAGSLLWAADPAGPLPATFKNAAELAAALQQSMAKGGDQSSAPIANESHYRVNIVRRDKPGPAMAHATGPAKGTEVHYILDGAATVVTGGTLIRPVGEARAGAASRIDNGFERHVAKGDVVVIPAGTPHWYKEVAGSVTYLEVRFDVDLK